MERRLTQTDEAFVEFRDRSRRLGVFQTLSDVDVSVFVKKGWVSQCLIETEGLRKLSTRVDRHILNQNLEAQVLETGCASLMSVLRCCGTNLPLK